VSADDCNPRGIPRVARLLGLGGSTRTLSEALHKVADEEHARMELATIAQPSMLRALTLEAERRAVLITEMARTTLWCPASTPIACAFRSVAADIAAGRLP